MIFLYLALGGMSLGLLQFDAGGYLVETPRGGIVARRVVMATNGYTAHLLKEFQGVIVPLRGHVTAQRPGLGMPRHVAPYLPSRGQAFEGGEDRVAEPGSQAHRHLAARSPGTPRGRIVAPAE